MVCIKKSSFPNHCLHHILPNERCSLHGMKMRKRGHNYNLHMLETEIVRKSFLNRMLFKYQWDGSQLLVCELPVVARVIYCIECIVYMYIMFLCFSVCWILFVKQCVWHCSIRRLLIYIYIYIYIYIQHYNFHSHHYHT